MHTAAFPTTRDGGMEPGTLLPTESFTQQMTLSMCSVPSLF